MYQTTHTRWAKPAQERARTMMFIKSVFRFIVTLGGLLSSQVDEGTDALTSTPAGIKSAYRMTRDKWKKQYHDVRTPYRNCSSSWSRSVRKRPSSKKKLPSWKS
jgi:hypothetical protein